MLKKVQYLNFSPPFSKGRRGGIIWEPPLISPNASLGKSIRPDHGRGRDFPEGNLSGTQLRNNRTQRNQGVIHEQIDHYY
jgi:hypothetical protein